MWRIVGSGCCSVGWHVSDSHAEGGREAKHVCEVLPALLYRHGAAQRNSALDREKEEIYLATLEDRLRGAWISFGLTQVKGRQMRIVWQTTHEKNTERESVAHEVSHMRLHYVIN